MSVRQRAREQLQDQRKKALERLFEEFKPSNSQLRRYDLARAAYADWLDYGLPESGGSLDQPAIWHYWMRVIKAAIRAADEERG